MGDTILSARHISKAFVGVQALDDVSEDIHAGETLCLVGENGSGKSTFVKTVSGIYHPDMGEIEMQGKAYEALSPKQAIRMGIQVIYQDLSLFDHMTIAENIAITRIRQKERKLIDWQEVYRIAKEQTDRIGVTLDLNTTVAETTIANRQITAICRALAQEAKILFMDEPTTALTKQEVSHLLDIVTELKNDGLGIVFISHKLEEVFEVADRITVFRDGKKIGTFPKKELTKKKLAYYMTGREIEYPHYRRQTEDGEALLDVRNISKKANYEEISFTIRRGDIVGLTGLLGSGRTELALSLFGLNPPDSGKVYFAGKPVALHSPSAAKLAGIALLPEDRYTQGMFNNMTISENISSVALEKITSLKGVLNKKKETDLAEKSVQRLHVKTPTVQTAIGSLSGGNQQKSIISKWMNRKPRLFIMDTPTVGVDIGSKEEIYALIQGFARDGMAVLLITDEMEELLTNCNRVLIMAEHRIIASLDEEDLKQPDIKTKIRGLISSQTAEGGRAQ